MTAGNNAPAGARTIKASELKAKRLKLMDEVAESGEEVIITKNGRPISRLAPYRTKPKTPFGRGRDTIRLLDDMTAPTGTAWEAEATALAGHQLVIADRRLLEWPGQLQRLDATE